MRARARLVLWGALLFVLLAAPGAGNVGGCGNQDLALDPVEHCFNVENAICFRERVADRATPAAADACFSDAAMTCPDAAWPEGCAPAPAEAGECIRTLRRNDLLPIPTDELLAMTDACELCP